MGSEGLMDLLCMLEGVTLILNTGVFLLLNLSDELRIDLFLICGVDSAFNPTVPFSIEAVFG